MVLSTTETIILGLLIGIVLILLIDRFFPKSSIERKSLKFDIRKLFSRKPKISTLVIAKVEQPKKPSFFKTLDFTEPTTGSILITLLLALIFALFPEYWYINVATPIYLIIGALLVIFITPVAFVKYYYMPMKKFVPEKDMFIASRKRQIPLTQEWDDNGFFKFVKATPEDIKNLPKSYTIRGLEIYQRIIPNTSKNVYKEAFQNISTNFVVTDIQAFRQIIEIMNKLKDNYLMKLIIVAAIGISMVLIALGVFLKFSGKA